ncbi:MAG: Holliday junction branch migration protein RuvA [Eggerthellales bacterium]|nr:Holliday junction branch migration protein RuvA [Eggerthellales bacterium]
MIAFLKGIVAMKSSSKAYFDVNGVGFEVNMSLTSLSALPDVGMPATVLTYMQVRDDGMALFGFSTEGEKALFEKLIGVSGVGPKVALAALSYFSPDDLVTAIAAEDVARVSKIPGIGKKTASRIILDLKGSFEMNAAQLRLGQAEAAPAAPADNGVRDALLSMGFTTAEIDLALKGAPEGAGESTLLQHALKRLSFL